MPLKILIIDNDVEWAKALAVYLERHQFDVLISDSTRKPLDLFKTNLPEIVLANPNLQDAEEVSRLLQMKGHHPQTQIIILTAPDFIEKNMKMFKANVLRYLKKPVSSVELDHALAQAREWISMQKKLEGHTRKLKDLHNVQILFQQLFDEVPCYITVQDRQFRITATNRLFKKDFGEEIGEYCYKIYKHRDTPCPICPVAATFEDGNPHQTEEVVTSKSGAQYNVLTWTAPIRNDADEITQVIEIATDITKIRKLQDNLTSLGLMLGSMSHSIKGMLTALDGGIYLLETGISRQDPDRICRAFDQIRQMVERIRKMVLDILFFTKSRKLQYQKIVLKELIDNIKDIIHPVVSRHNIKLNISIASAIQTIEIDPDWFRSAIINFLENAVDACSNDANKENHQIDLHVYNTGTDQITFEIKDNGLGMDQETREKMFTIFFSSKGSKGTGLGLYIANNVIRLHGGTIQVESEISNGTRFVISVPKKEIKNG